MNEKKVLVTGAGGFLGRYLVPRLHRDGATVVAVDLPRSRLDKLANYEGVKIRTCDLTHPAEIKALLNEERPNSIVHLASVLNCPDEELNYKVNYEATRNLGEAMLTEGIHRIVFMSSMTATFEQLNAYGRSKKLAEEYLKEKGFEWTIVRPNLIYGRGGAAFEKLVGFVRMLPWVVPVMGDGKVLKQPIHVEDMAEFLERVLAGHTIGETFQVGGPDRISFNAYLDIVMKTLSLKKIKVHAPYSFCLMAAKILTAVIKNPPLTSDNIYELNQSVEVESQSLQERFSFKMRSLTEGLKQTLCAS